MCRCRYWCVGVGKCRYGHVWCSSVQCSGRSWAGGSESAEDAEAASVAPKSSAQIRFAISDISPDQWSVITWPPDHLTTWLSGSVNCLEEGDQKEGGWQGLPWRWEQICLLVFFPNISKQNSKERQSSSPPSSSSSSSYSSPSSPRSPRSWFWEVGPRRQQESRGRRKSAVPRPTFLPDRNTFKLR